MRTLQQAQPVLASLILMGMLTLTMVFAQLVTIAIVEQPTPFLALLEHIKMRKAILILLQV
jgi:hypothetical protein